MSEHAIAAHFEYLCLLAGAQRLAYVPVVASGYVDQATIQCSPLTMPSYADQTH